MSQIDTLFLIMIFKNHETVYHSFFTTNFRSTDFHSTNFRRPDILIRGIQAASVLQAISDIYIMTKLIILLYYFSFKVIAILKTFFAINNQKVLYKKNRCLMHNEEAYINGSNAYLWHHAVAFY